MRYALINAEKATEIGIDITYLQKKGKKVIVNENDILNSLAKGVDVESKAASLGCKLISLSDLKNIKAKGGWK